MGEKMTVYIPILCGISLLAYYSGLVTTSPLILLLTNVDTIFSSEVFTNIYAAFGLFTVAGSGLAILALAYIGKTDLIAAGLVATVLFNFAFDLVNIYLKIVSINSGYYSPLGVMLIAPFALLWMITVFEWWRGLDT